MNKQDILIILKASVKMAQQDAKLVESEKNLLHKIMELGKIDPMDISDFNEPIKEDIAELSKHLSSDKAKKLFLLTVATVALADETIEKQEMDFLTRLTKSLGVGRVKIEALTYDQCKSMVFKMISDIEKNDEVDHSFQPSDLDLHF
ncbi:MAG: TerB family tellurite resistance protein [Deltaproteobacteria bacterium]|nr:TerB family tellurite resistance protein [Deltaproteobacteria bacterium]